MSHFVYNGVSLFLSFFLPLCITAKSGAVLFSSLLFSFSFFASHHFAVPLVWPSDRLAFISFVHRQSARYWNDLYTFSNVALIWQSNKSKWRNDNCWTEQRAEKRMRGTCRGHIIEQRPPVIGWCSICPICTAAAADASQVDTVNWQLPLQSLLFWQLNIFCFKC